MSTTNSCDFIAVVRYNFGFFREMCRYEQQMIRFAFTGCIITPWVIVIFAHGVCKACTWDLQSLRMETAKLAHGNCR